MITTFSPNVPLIKTIGFVLLTVLLGTLAAKAQEPSIPHFRNEVIVLTFSDNQLLRDPDLSPSGDLVFAHAASYGRREVPPEPFLDAFQYLWNIQGLEDEGNLTYLQRTQQIRLDDTERGHGWAFSPDGQYLALGTPTDLQVFTLPELEAYRSAPIVVNEGYPPSDNLSWSADGHFLSVLVGNDIVAWNVTADIFSRHTLGRLYQSVDNVGTSWYGYVASYEEQGAANGFFVCTLDLENCREYELPYWPLFVAGSHNGEVILVQRGSDFSDEGAIIQTWRRQPGEEYEPEETELSTKQVGCPRSFSPSNRYMATACDPREWTIREFPSFTTVLSLPPGDRPTWLRGEEYLVTFNPFNLALSLYGIHSEEPIDILEFRELVGEEIDRWVDSEATTSQFPDVSADGQQVLINLGWAAFVVQIVSE